MDKINLLNLSLGKVKQACEQMGFSGFKAREIFRFCHQKLASSIDDMTTLKIDERQLLGSKYYMPKIKIAAEQKTLGVIKTLFQLEDGQKIETVFMDNKNDKATVCVSSQVGCPIKCAFCATGQLKFVRNLSVAEILIQVYYFAKNHPISNLVFMGMGEPFLNYENVLAAAKILNEELGLNIASRKIVFSTVGIVPGILKLKEESKQFRLAWSLISAFDDTRKNLINYRGLSTIKEVVQAIQQYQKKTKRRITIEYVLLKGINDSYKDMHALADICRQIDVHVNLIPFNLSKGICFTGGKVEAAYKILKQLKINVTTRTSLGGEILAACGQLAGQ